MIKLSYRKYFFSPWPDVERFRWPVRTSYAEDSQYKQKVGYFDINSATNIYYDIENVKKLVPKIK